MISRPDAASFTERGLEFHPADPQEARRLTPEQLAQYNADGHLGRIDVLDRTEVDELRRLVDDLLEHAAASGRSSYAINGYHAVCAPLWDLATDPRLVGLAADILGPQLVCWGTHLFAKLPGDGKEVPFHQDAVYWPFTPSRTVTVWLAVDDVGPDNSPVVFVPGSHLWGPVAHEVLEADDGRVLERRAVGADGYRRRHANELRAGQASLHSDLMLHGSTPNTSVRRRAGLTLRYAAADVRLVEGHDEWRQRSIHVLDGDPEGFWADLPRPDGDWRDELPPDSVDAS